MCVCERERGRERETGRDLGLKRRGGEKTTDSDGHWSGGSIPHSSVVPDQNCTSTQILAIDLVVYRVLV